MDIVYTAFVCLVVSSLVWYQLLRYYKKKADNYEKLYIKTDQEKWDQYHKHMDRQAELQKIFLTGQTRENYRLKRQLKNARDKIAKLSKELNQNRGHKK